MSEIRGEAWSIIRRAMDTPHTDDFEAESAYRDAYASEAAEKVIALLADRAATVAEPDEETVERVAKAMYYAWPRAVDWEKLTHHKQKTYRRDARAAIAAMPSGKDDSWLDELTAIEAEHEIVINEFSVRSEEEGFRCDIYAGIEHDDPLLMMIGYGTGTTRREAILDAVQKAKEAVTNG